MNREVNIYEEKLKNIISEYDLIPHNSVDSTYIHGIVMSLFQQKCLDKRVALWGAGRSNSLTSHASVILTKYSSLLRGMVCLIDSCKELQGRSFMDYKIISPEDIDKYDIDIVIVASRSSAESIKKSLKEYAPNCDVIDIYEELRKRGIDLLYNFYEEKSSYRDLYELRVSYEKETDCLKKAKKLKELIGSYLGIRDIYYALHYLNEYIENRYEEAEKLQEASLQIKQLLYEIKTANRSRKGDVNIHFIDALRAMDVYHEVDGKGTFTYLPNYFQKGVYFKNCYATGATTYESIISILQEQYSYAKNVYENNFIFKMDEVPLFVKAYNNELDINLYSSEEWRIIYEDERVNYVNQIHMSQKLWTMFCTNAAAEKKQFNFMYYAWELHFPLACGFHRKAPVTMNFPDVGVKDMSGFIEEQFTDCLDYVEKQFEFYEDFYSEECYRVIFSDHSQVVYDKDKFVPYYMYYNNKERATHCILSISGPEIASRIYSEYISMIDFTKIFCNFVFDKREIIEFPDAVRYQYYNIHNKTLREIAREKGFTDYIDGIIVLMNQTYLYVCTATGKEEVYLQENIEKNIIDTEYGKEIASECKMKYDLSFPEFLQIHL